MNQNILIECGLFINNQIICQERLFDYHQKAYATLDKLLNVNLKGYSFPVLHLHMWEVKHTIMQAKKLNLSILNTLFSLGKFVEASKKRSGSNHGNREKPFKNEWLWGHC